MPKFIEQILEMPELNEEFMEFEIPDFPENSDEEILIPDAFVFDNIETM